MKPIKGRGALSNASGRYETIQILPVEEEWQLYEEPTTRFKTQWRYEQNKTVLTRNQSPDIHFDRSLNPYRGCEHGCIYCFARPTHTWLGHSAGLDFETKIYAKSNAVKQLEAALARPGYKPAPVAIGVNTDAYQPLERSLKITRSLLEVLWAHRHPIYLITKSALIERDIDLLSKFAEERLVSTCVSLCSLNPHLSRKLEPRAASPKRRLRTIRTLSDAGIPTRVSLSPVIPALNEEEMDTIIEQAAHAGATAAFAIILRLPHELQQLFPEWLEEHYPLRAKRILKAIQSMRGQKLNNSEFGSRMLGSGPRADIIQQRFTLACKKAGLSTERDFKLDSNKFTVPCNSGQLNFQW